MNNPSDSKSNSRSDSRGDSGATAGVTAAAAEQQQSNIGLITELYWSDSGVTAERQQE